MFSFPNFSQINWYKLFHIIFTSNELLKTLVSQTNLYDIAIKFIPFLSQHLYSVEAKCDGFQKYNSSYTLFEVQVVNPTNSRIRCITRWNHKLTINVSPCPFLQICSHNIGSRNAYKEIPICTPSSLYLVL